MKFEEGEGNERIIMGTAASPQKKKKRQRRKNSSGVEVASCNLRGNFTSFTLDSEKLILYL